MKRFLLSLITFSMVLLPMMGCRPSVDEILPPITSHGANTFGCKVNKRLGYYAKKKCTYTFFELSCVGVSMNDERLVRIKSTSRATNSKDYGYKTFIILFYVDSVDLCVRFKDDEIVREDSHVNLLRYDDNVIAGTFFIRFKNGEIWYDGRFDLSF